MNRIRRQAPALALCTLTVLGLSGCHATSGHGVRRSIPDAPLTSTEWECSSIAGQAMPEGPRPTLTITLPDRANGLAGVNRYFGSVDFDRESMRFSKLGATRMAGPPERMELERSFLDALERSRAFRLEGPSLTLMDDAGAVVATFAAPADAAGITPASR